MNSDELHSTNQETDNASPLFPPPDFTLQKMLSILPEYNKEDNIKKPVVNIKIKTHNVDTFTFVLSRVLPSYANAIRRTILSDIPVVGFLTTPYEENKATIIKNTSKFNNEYLKQRLSCIPIHNIDAKLSNEELLGKYVELKVKNNTDSMLWVTTQDFELFDKNTREKVPGGEKIIETLFPPFVSPIDDTKHYIDLLILRPFISESLPKEEINLTCEFSICTAKQNSCYNVSQQISYENTSDVVKIANKIKELKIENQSKNQTDLNFMIKNFELLEAKRLFIPNSFNFIVKSIGIYNSKTLVQHACGIIADNLNILMDAIMTSNESIITIRPNLETTIPNCWDIILHNEDYTLGTMLNDQLFRNFCQMEKNKDEGQEKSINNMLDFCGFKKEHPHDTFSVIRVGFADKTHSHIEFIQFMFSKIIPTIRDEFEHMQKLLEN